MTLATDRRLATRQRRGAPGALLPWTALILSLWASPAFGRRFDAVNAGRLAAALRHTSYKVRLQAAISVGKGRVAAAAGALRAALEDPRWVVQVAAAVSAGQIGDQGARAGLVTLLTHRKSAVARSALKSLILLDRARPAGRPVTLVSITWKDSPLDEAGVFRRGLIAALRTRISRSRILVLSAGEERVLAPRKLKAHLNRRKLAGVTLSPKITTLDTKPAGGAIKATGGVSVLVLSLPGKRMVFVGSSQAAVTMSGGKGPVWARRVAGAKATVIEAAAGAATDEVIRYLTRSARKRR